MFKGKRKYEVSDPAFYDAFVKSRKIPLFVIPEEAGNHLYQMVTACLDFVFHRSEDFLRIHQTF